MRNAIIRNITVKADELARQYNKTKDSSIRDQWYRAVKAFALISKIKVDKKLNRFKRQSQVF